MPKSASSKPGKIEGLNPIKKTPEKIGSGYRKAIQKLNLSEEVGF